MAMNVPMPHLGADCLTHGLHAVKHSPTFVSKRGTKCVSGRASMLLHVLDELEMHKSSTVVKADAQGP